MNLTFLYLGGVMLRKPEEILVFKLFLNFRTYENAYYHYFNSSTKEPELDPIVGSDRVNL